jgi:RNA polymerase sigma-70 factor, ECF subfamily
MARIASGDEAAFAELYDQLAPTLYGIVLRVVRDPAQSEEVTQEVFVELWRRASRFDLSRGGLRGWAVTIAHRRAVDVVRSEQSRRDRHVRDAATPAGTAP